MHAVALETSDRPFAFSEKKNPRPLLFSVVVLFSATSPGYEPKWHLKRTGVPSSFQEASVHSEFDLLRISRQFWLNFKQLHLKEKATLREIQFWSTCNPDVTLVSQSRVFKIAQIASRIRACVHVPPCTRARTRVCTRYVCVCVRVCVLRVCVHVPVVFVYAHAYTESRRSNNLK